MRSTLIVALPMLLAASAVSVHAEDVAGLIKRQSQEFSDASAINDTATLGKLLDDRVLFMNEGGDMPTKKDIAAGPPAPKNGNSNSLTQTDFKIEVHGNVAVTSFTDNSTQKVFGQTILAKYMSTEVWMKEGQGWKMISSQTMAVPEDPATVMLPSKALDEYVGTYEADPTFKFHITRSGDELSGAVNDGKPFAMKAELRDVLITPGQPRLRRIFQRDADGKITGFVSRREGHDLLLKRVG